MEVISGNNTDIWDGRTDSGELAPDGTYQFVINGVNAHDALDTWKISDKIIIDDTLPIAKINIIKAHTPKYGHYTLVGTATDEHFDIAYVQRNANELIPV